LYLDSFLFVFEEKGMLKVTRSSWVSLSCVLLASTIAVREYVLTGFDSPSTPETSVAQAIPAQELPSSPSAEVHPVVLAEPEPIEKLETVRIGKGDTMMSILTSRGITREEAHKAIQEISKIYNPKALKIGQEIHLKYKKPVKDAPGEVLSIDFKASTGNQFCLNLEEGQFKAKKFEIQLTKLQKRIRGQINSSFYQAALKKGVPAPIVKEAIAALSYDINWQHDPQSGDEFEIVFDVYEDPDGNIIKQGELKYASFAPSGQVRKIYSFQHKNGQNGYYNEKGVSVVKCLLQTPLDPTKMRITSKFGRRHHPILGYSKQHKGIDFGAPNGTPVMSAGDGVVVKAGWNGAYGNYVLIRHNKDYSTAYAHLSKMHVKPGMHVKQRQVIGAVGTTGRSTGPHLHYEVIYRGSHVNPQGIKQLPTTQLDGKELARFQQARAQVDKELNRPAANEIAAQTVPAQAG
jgi:murein DD-endopeptidase MepM/ murein hydrolase activator NlpD